MIQFSLSDFKTAVLYILKACSISKWRCKTMMILHYIFPIKYIIKIRIHISNFTVYMESNITDMKMITPFKHSILYTLFQHLSNSKIIDIMMLWSIMVLTIQTQLMYSTMELVSYSILKILLENIQIYH